MKPYIGEDFEWAANSNAIQMARGVAAIEQRFHGDYSEAAENAYFSLGAAVLPALRASRKRVAEVCAAWFDDSAFRRCTCYVLPHADDCGALIGITKSGERVYAE